MNWITKIIKRNEAEYTFDHVCTLFWLILVYFLLYKHSERVTKYRDQKEGGNHCLGLSDNLYLEPFFRLLPFFKQTQIGFEKERYRHVTLYPCNRECKKWRSDDYLEGSLHHWVSNPWLFSSLP